MDDSARHGTVIGHLRRLHPIRWLRDHPVGADLILAVVVTAVSLTLHLLNIEQDEDGAADPAWWTVPLVVGSTLPIAWRRSHTIASTLVVVTTQVIAAFADIDGTGFIGVVIALYSLGAHASGPTRFRAILYIDVLITTLFIAGLFSDEVTVGDFISSVVILVTAFVLGDNLRRRRDAAAALRERAERAERERELVAQQQVNAERSRIARELHDVVAHSVSVMVIQAAAARRSLHTSPDNAEHALSNIEDTGRQTMNELRGILGVLRRSEPTSDGRTGPSTTPQPTLADLTSLVRLSDDLPIDLAITGRFDDLPNSVTLTGYRVIQEALTNIRRHAGPVTRVEVTVRRHDDHVEIAITDDGRGAAADEVGPGFGLLGMHERVAAVGGSVTAGWQRGGGWRVAVRLPAESTGPMRPDTAVDDADVDRTVDRDAIVGVDSTRPTDSGDAVTEAPA